MADFPDRADAGRRLARRLLALRRRNPVVVGLPRGGVPVAFEVAHALDAELDVILVRKLGVPFQPELAMGAIGEAGVHVLSPEVVCAALIAPDQITESEHVERPELAHLAERLRSGNPRVPLAGRTVVVVDDGVATGATARAACRVAREEGATRVVLAVPVAAAVVVPRLRLDADEVVCLRTPQNLRAIGEHYAHFTQVTDEEISTLLARARGDRPPMATHTPTPSDPAAMDEEVTVPAGGATLAGHLTVPQDADGMVIFAHTSGSGRHSPRTRFTAGVLHRAGLGTLLVDLLHPASELDRSLVLNAELLAGRLADATRWLRDRHAERIGYWGAGTGAAAALWAAAEPDTAVAAVVSRGGRPDLAWPRLGLVRAPTLFIVGSRDDLLDANLRARTRLRCANHVAVVPDANHLFEAPGVLREAADLARDWFTDHLARAGAAAHVRS
jgi:putative phosphoribosyl transferase